MTEFIDKRDGNSYKVVKIGNLFWFAENLKYQGVDHHFPDRNSDNLHKYGCLYTWENAKLAGPPGWRLPTKKDLERLLTITGAGSNSSSIRTSSWLNGSDYSGFNALPAGRKNIYGNFGSFRSFAYFWSVTPNGRDRAYAIGVDFSHADVFDIFISNAFSVRCVKEI